MKAQGTYEQPMVSFTYWSWSLSDDGETIQLSRADWAGTIEIPADIYLQIADAARTARAQPA